MKKPFTKVDADKIGQIIGCLKRSDLQDRFRYKIVNLEDGRELVLEIHPETTLGNYRGTLIVVYTGTSHLQLHNCTGYVISEELGEVTFVAESEGRLSGLVVEQGASCSLYAAIDRNLISTDFTQLGVEVMLSGVAMSLVEEVVSDTKETGNSDVDDSD